MTVSHISALRPVRTVGEGPELDLARAAEVAEQRLFEIVDRVTAEVADQVPGYEVFPGTASENRWVIAMIVAAMRSGRPCGSREGELIRQRAHRWAQDLPLDIVTAAFHVGLRSLVRVVTEMGDLDEQTTVALQDHAWAFAMLSGSILAEVQRDRAVAAAHQDGVRRATFLRDLAAGRLTPDRLSVEGPAYGLDLEHEYYAVRARGTDRQLVCLEARLRHAGGTRALPVLSLIEEGHLIAVAARRPALGAELTVALGGPRRVSEIHSSFAEAADVLDTARAFGVDGTVDLIAIGPLTLATVGDRLARRLADHYLDGRDDAFNEIADTVRSLIDHDLGIDQTASSMHVHRNTIRYRVQRFRELTGLDIRHTSDLVTIWWLLKWRSLHGE